VPAAFTVPLMTPRSRTSSRKLRVNIISGMTRKLE
jgi:hypothetical protein